MINHEFFRRNRSVIYIMTKIAVIFVVVLCNMNTLGIVCMAADVQNDETDAGNESLTTNLLQSDQKKESDPALKVTDIDIEQYQKTMRTGDTQRLVINVIPLNATEYNITYISSDENVITVNGIGRITAVGIGNADIVISAGDVSKTISIEVTSGVEEKVAVVDIDFGTIRDVMKPGESQLLVASVIPSGATHSGFSYHSSNGGVASINGMGRIHAYGIGETEIFVTAGEVTRSFILSVTEEGDNYIAVTDIDIDEHDEEIIVGGTLRLSSTVVPATATKQKITYTSSDPSVATVSQMGTVKGIGPGIVTITLSADKVVKEISIKIRVKTTAIRIDENYIVLKPGESKKLSAIIKPENANQELRYQAADESVATVDDNGIITAIGTGDTSVYVSNGDMTVSVSVIVNQRSEIDGKLDEMKSEHSEKKQLYSRIIYANKIKVITSDMLLYLYTNTESLVVVGDGYSIMINGSDIRNHKNELLTDIHLSKQNNELSFNINNGDHLCGAIELYLDEITGQYLYLLNKATQIYERIDADDLSCINITTPGKYIITDHLIKTRNGSVKKHVTVAFTITCIFGLVYVCTKKKHWFW